MTTDSTEAVIGAIIFALCLLVYIPVCSRFIYNFYQLRNEQSFEKRYGYLSVTTSIVCLAEIVILTFLILDHANLVIFSFNFLWMFQYLAINWSLLLRCWLIHFQFNWHNCIATFDDGFIRCLTTKYFHGNWYLAHLTDYGNYEWCKKRLVVLWFVLGTAETLFVIVYAYQSDPSSVLAAVFGYLAWFVGFALIASTFFGALFFYYYLPKLRDVFFLNLETLYILRLLLVSNVAWIVNVFVIEAYSSNVHTVFLGPHPRTLRNHTQQSGKGDAPFMVLILMVLCSVQLNFGLIFVSTKWTADKIRYPFNNLMIKYCQELKKQHQQRSSHTNNKSNNSNSNSNSEYDESLMNEFLTPRQKMKQNLLLKQIFTEKMVFELFLKHVTLEFSLMSLVALVEFVQFKQYVYRVANETIFILPEKAMMYLFVSRLPYSSLVYNYEKRNLKQIMKDDAIDDDPTLIKSEADRKLKKELRHVKRVCWRLYRKYIAFDAEFYLGMPLDIHRKFHRNWFKSDEYFMTEARDLKFSHFYHFYDECEIYLEDILTFSLSRFKNRLVFDKVMAKLSWMFDPKIREKKEKEIKETQKLLSETTMAIRRQSSAGTKKKKKQKKQKKPEIEEEQAQAQEEEEQKEEQKEHREEQPEIELQTIQQQEIKLQPPPKQKH